MYDDSKNGLAPGSNTKPAVNQEFVPSESNPYECYTPTPEFQPNEAHVQNMYYQKDNVDLQLSPPISHPLSPPLSPSPSTRTASDNYGTSNLQPAGQIPKACPEDDKIEEFEEATQDTTKNDSSGSKPSKIVRILCVLLALFFLVYGIAMFSIAVSEFNKNVEMYPGAELVSPHVSIPILHWFFIVFAVGFCLCFAILGLELWFIHLIVGIIMVGFWIAYGCVAGLSKESEAASNPYSNGSYINYGQEMKQAVPYYHIYLHCEIYNNSGDNIGSESTYGKYIYPDIHNDSTVFPTLQEHLDLMYRVQLETSFKQGNNLIATLDNAELAEYRNRPSNEYNKRYVCDTRRSVIIPNYKKNIVVTKDGTLPASISNGVRVATEIFWAGVYYCYRFAARAIAVVVTLKKSLDMKSIKNY